PRTARTEADRAGAVDPSACRSARFGPAKLRGYSMCVSVHRLDGKSYPVNLDETIPYRIRFKAREAISLGSRIQRSLTGPDPAGISPGTGPFSPALRDLRYWKSERAWFVGLNYTNLNPKSRGDLLRYQEIDPKDGRALARASGHGLPPEEATQPC